jgi:hypothetical protein
MKPRQGRQTFPAPGALELSDPDRYQPNLGPGAIRLESKDVHFAWKDYAQGQRLREMTLSGEELFSRLLLHVLPDRFVRIRYHGLLANRQRERALALGREVLPNSPAQPKLTKSDWQSLLQSLTGVDPMKCEVCEQNALHL